MEPIKDEVLLIQQLRNSENYEITHNTSQRLSWQELRDTTLTIKNTIEQVEKRKAQLEKQLEDAPLMVKGLQDGIDACVKELGVLRSRFAKFEEAVGPLPEQEDKVLDLTDSNQSNS